MEVSDFFFPPTHPSILVSRHFFFFSLPSSVTSEFLLLSCSLLAWIAAFHLKDFRTFLLDFLFVVGNCTVLENAFLAAAQVMKEAFPSWGAAFNFLGSKSRRLDELTFRHFGFFCFFIARPHNLFNAFCQAVSRQHGKCKKKKKISAWVAAFHFLGGKIRRPDNQVVWFLLL